MKICKNCKEEIDNQAYICPKCGAVQENISATSDNGGFLWGLLGFLIPVAGLVLFLVWKDTKPKTAKSAGKGALVGVIVGVIGYVAVLILNAMMFMV